MNLLPSIILSFVLLNVVTWVDAHTVIASLIVGGTTLPSKQCLRPYPDTAYDSPIASIATTDMTCGKMPEAGNPAGQKCSVAAGATVGFLWKHTFSAADVIDPSHRGPCYVYMAKASTSGQGSVWFKIYESGYDTSTSKFCVDTLIQNNGVLNFVIPADIEAGDYLLRGEILALHEAYKEGGVQPYVHCAEITVTGGGSAKPADLTAFPGTYTAQMKGVIFDIYKSPMDAYPSLGPKIYTAGTTSGTASSSGTPSSIVDGTGSNTANRTCSVDADCPSKVCRVDRTCLPDQGIGAGGVVAIIFAMLFLVTVVVLGAGYYVLYKAKPGSKAAALRDKI